MHTGHTETMLVPSVVSLEHETFSGSEQVINRSSEMSLCWDISEVCWSSRWAFWNKAELCIPDICLISYLLSLPLISVAVFSMGLYTHLPAPSCVLGIDPSSLSCCRDETLTKSDLQVRRNLFQFRGSSPTPRVRGLWHSIWDLYERLFCVLFLPTWCS